MKHVTAALSLFCLFTFFAPQAHADSVVIFSNVRAIFPRASDGQFTFENAVDLGTTSVVQVPAGSAGTFLGFRVGFIVDLTGGPAVPGDTLRFTLTQTGGNSATPTLDTFSFSEVIDLTIFNPPGNVVAYPVFGLGPKYFFTGGSTEAEPFMPAFVGFLTIEISGPSGTQTQTIPLTIERTVPTPEPATILLLSSGLAGIGAAVRRRRRAAAG